MKSITFIASMASYDAEQKCMENYNRYGDECTIQTTKVPFLKVGQIGVYTVSVRFARTFNQKPTWGYSLECGGCTDQAGFDSIEKAIDAATDLANEKDVEFRRRLESESKGYVRLPVTVQPGLHTVAGGCKNDEKVDAESNFDHANRLRKHIEHLKTSNERMDLAFKKALEEVDREIAEVERYETLDYNKAIALMTPEEITQIEKDFNHELHRRETLRLKASRLR
jgi:hypothetical protein